MFWKYKMSQRKPAKDDQSLGESISEGLPSIFKCDSEILSSSVLESPWNFDY